MIHRIRVQPDLGVPFPAVDVPWSPLAILSPSLSWGEPPFFLSGAHLMFRNACILSLNNSCYSVGLWKLYHHEHNN